MDVRFDPFERIGHGEHGLGAGLLSTFVLVGRCGAACVEIVLARRTSLPLALGILLFRCAALVSDPARQLPLLCSHPIVPCRLLGGAGGPCIVGDVVRCVPHIDPPTDDPQRPGGHVVEERAVVRHHDATSSEAVERSNEEIASFAIEVVGRLVQQEDIGLGSQRGSDLPSLPFTR